GGTVGLSAGVRDGDAGADLLGSTSGRSRRILVNSSRARPWSHRTVDCGDGEFHSVALWSGSASGTVVNVTLSVDSPLSWSASSGRSSASSGSTRSDFSAALRNLVDLAGSPSVLVDSACFSM